jgi:hypothetical protein
MQQPVPPSWFKQRQGKIEPAGDSIVKLTAPNVEASFIGIRSVEGGRWSAALMKSAGGPDVVATGPHFTTQGDAWGAAFELYRTQILV